MNYAASKIVDKLLAAAPLALAEWVDTLSGSENDLYLIASALFPQVPEIFIGSPSASGEMFRFLSGLGPVMLSSGGLYSERDGKGGFRKLPDQVWMAKAVALDSSGFVAMNRFGGYRWTPEEYVRYMVDLVTDGKPFPFVFWSSMDYACERDIAPDRAEVERRIQLTTDTLGELLSYIDDWSEEGLIIPDPMPVLQGRTTADYQESARQIGEVLHASGRAWPELIGVGSVCNRPIRDTPDGAGIVSVVRAVHEVLPPHVRLHMFGVKGGTLREIARQPGTVRARIASLDSMAFEKTAQWEAWERKKTDPEHKKTVKDRARIAAHWRDVQAAALDGWMEGIREAQGALFGG